MGLLQQEKRDRPGNLASKLSISAERRTVQLDAEGYLLNPADWSVAITEQMAEYDNLILTDDHWQLIDFLHRFFREYQLAPELSVLSRNLCRDQHNCRWTRKYINRLFPGGTKTACRYAGLPAHLGRSCIY